MHLGKGIHRQCYMRTKINPACAVAARKERRGQVFQVLRAWGACTPASTRQVWTLVFTACCSVLSTVLRLWASQVPHLISIYQQSHRESQSADDAVLASSSADPVGLQRSFTCMLFFSGRRKERSQASGASLRRHCRMMTMRRKVAWRRPSRSSSSCMPVRKP